jgi:hypothetical protein
VVLTSVILGIGIIVGLIYAPSQSQMVFFGHHDDTNAIFSISGDKTDYLTFTLNVYW